MRRPPRGLLEPAIARIRRSSHSVNQCVVPRGTRSIRPAQPRPKQPSSIFRKKIPRPARMNRTSSSSCVCSFRTSPASLPDSAWQDSRRSHRPSHSRRAASSLRSRSRTPQAHHRPMHPRQRDPGSSARSQCPGPQAHCESPARYQSSDALRGKRRTAMTLLLRTACEMIQPNPLLTG